MDETDETEAEEAETDETEAEEAEEAETDETETGATITRAEIRSAVEEALDPIRGGLRDLLLASGEILDAQATTLARASVEASAPAPEPEPEPAPDPAHRRSRLASFLWGA